MRSPPQPRRSAPDGFTLLEVMVSLALLLVGMLGLAQLQIYGVTGNQGARAQTLAASLARELATGLERLDPTDSRLALTGSAGSSAPSGFGSLLADATAATVWDDTTPIPGVTLDSTLERDPSASTSQPLYHRRWTVWGYEPGGGTTAAVRLIAVSVVYRERHLAVPREVLIYTQKIDPQLVMSNVQAYR